MPSRSPKSTKPAALRVVRSEETVQTFLRCASLQVVEVALPGFVLQILLLLLTLSVAADEVEMGFPDCIPPYVFSANDQGIEVDIAREALAFRGHTLRPRYFRIDRLPLAFRFGRVDAVMVNFGADLTPSGGHNAEATAVYEDVLISLADRTYAITDPESIRGHLLIAFEGARFYYPDWVAPAESEGLYFETSNQLQQVQGLLRGKFDLMLSDRYIFRFFANKLAREQEITLPEVVEHEFTALDQTFHRPVFRSARVRDDYNAGLAALRASGRYQAIYAYYLDPTCTELSQLGCVASESH